MKFSELIHECFSEQEQTALAKIGKFLLGKYFEPHYLENDTEKRIHLTVAVSDHDITRLCGYSSDDARHFMSNLAAKNFGTIRKADLATLKVENDCGDVTFAVDEPSECWLIDLNREVMFDELFIPLIESIQV